MLKKLAWTLVVIVLAVAAAGDPAAVDHYYARGLAPLYLDAARAAMRGDKAAAAAAFSKALQLAPEDTITLWEAAQASAGAGQPRTALDLLQKLAAQRPGWDPRAEPAFSSLLKEPRFEAVAKLLAPAISAHAATLAFTVDERDLICEGVAYDAETKTVFLGSIHKRKIVAIGPDGKARDFVHPGQDGLLEALGMKVEGGLLWVASYVESGEGAGAAAVHAFDARSGHTVEKYGLPAGREKRLFNDVALVGDHVYVTESLRGGVYRIDRKSKTLELFLPERTFLYPNGIAVDATGRRLFVASWGPGISIVDLATRKVSQLAYAPGPAPIGIDGLYYRERTLIGVQNGVQPNRVTRFRLDDAEAAVIATEVLEAGHPAFEIPTTGALAGRDLLVIANSQLERLKEGRIVKRTEPVRILRLALE